MACLPARVTSLWPASWTSFLDKTRSCRSTEVGRIWEVCDKHLQYVPRVFLDGIWAALGAGDVSTAWRVWSFAAEVSLLSVFQLAGGPTPDGEFRCGRGVARFRSTVLGGPVVGEARADVAEFVNLYKDRCIAGLISERHTLQCVLEVLDGIARHGISLPRSLEQGAQWRAVLPGGPQCLLCRADLAIDPDLGLPVFGACVLQLHSRLSEFLLQPDMVPPSPFLAVILASRLVVVVFCLTLLLLTSSLGRLGFPSSEGRQRGC